MKEDTGIPEYVMLGILARMLQISYTIKKWVEGEYNHFWQESFGQICPTLKKLVAEGPVVSSDRTQPGNGHGQIAYSTTSAGKGELPDWLQKKPEIERLQYEISFKISFG